MSRTKVLRHQHNIIVGSISRLAGMIEECGARDALAVHLGLNRLTAMLRIHLRQEDEFFYPELIGSDDPAVAETARAFRTEVGELWQQYELFAARWPSRHVIAADFDQFRAESRIIFTAIDDRCRREDEQLFPLADASEERPARLRA